MDAPYKPSVKLLFYLSDVPKIIASAGKMTLSHRDVATIFGSMDDTKVVEWIRELVRRGHTSPFEHSIYVFEVVCSRVASHQIVRHRIAGYTQLSQRYSENFLRLFVKSIASYLGREDLYVDSPRNREGYKSYVHLINIFIDSGPEYDTLLDIVSTAFIVPPNVVKNRDRSFLESLVVAVGRYYDVLAKGYTYEDARFLLPQAIKTRLLVSMNARELIESFLPLRMCIRAQWEIRYIAWNLWRQLMEIHPDIFRYIGPRCIHIDSRVRKNLCSLDEYLDGRCSFEISRCPELVDREAISQCLKTTSRDPYEP
ncbi:thymidylate synthase (FAD) [Ignisphaera aggregans DSM 17230]|uniref:Flavin-dependent thymidylate synthase n=1 Tax=Ignisphaera aggregans (strain DSM 17230 / JCM 13409 / AQ1.S1) TaxID=583356 RepID=E0SST0_IGNAA|nr:thymidylate synthase (FAD) [Ignisphaera aggregans DSM 17230]